MNQLLDLLFNKGETFCVSPNKLGYRSITRDEFASGEIKMIPPSEAYNPEPFWTKSSDIQLVALNPISGFRRDENVQTFRSFLVELDDGSLKEQHEYIKKIGLPYSCCIFSGSKSLHYAVTLDEDLPDEETYRVFAEWILRIVSKADQKTKNPSRSIRFAGNIRKETGNEMKLLELHGRVKFQKLTSWLSKHPDMDPRKDIKPVSEEVINPGEYGIPMWVWNKLKNGVDGSNGGRNNEWYGIFKEFKKTGLSCDNIMEILEPYFVPERDFRLSEWKTTAKSACKK